MSAMRSWDLMAQAGPRPVLSGRANGTKVVVLGAGVSGLTVGYELGKLGYNVRILEARDRVGGVNWTLRRGSTHTEVGPAAKRRSATSTRVSTTTAARGASPLAYRRPWILQGARRAARGLHQRERVVVLLLRGTSIGPLAASASGCAK